MMAIAQAAALFCCETAFLIGTTDYHADGDARISPQKRASPTKPARVIPRHLSPVGILLNRNRYIIGLFKTIQHVTDFDGDD